MRLHLMFTFKTLSHPVLREVLGGWRDFLEEYSKRIDLLAPLY